ncbi:UNKNOWN [Stylonychia lemnae]|uniref:Uncharacterized protein n=1 Tax=Stylonychia lemnae TaxID=5949 RepID=A0A077ZXW0_STYLE|nr:UNKNOWN [Stylonychia lemnae]|eukprot:CDW74427.1 UNKNOWN [Stylonychia lemnae]
MSATLPALRINRRIAPLEDSGTLHLKIAILVACGATCAYKRKFFGHEKNYFNLAMHSIGVFYGTYLYTKTFLDPVSEEAARINNSNEYNHQRSLGNI